MRDLRDPVETFLAMTTEHPRCFWLDGGGARDWSGTRSIMGWLDDDDVSLTYDASSGVVTRHTDDGAEPVGDDVFAVLAAELATGRPDDQWFGYLGYAARPDLPAAPDPHQPDAIWMRCRHVRLFQHAVAPGRPGVVSREAPPAPAAYVEAFAEVQEQLHAGNSYEVNLTHRLEAICDDAPAEVYLRLRALNPAPYAGFLQHAVPGARGWLLSSSPERYAQVSGRVLTTKPIKGTTPRGATAIADRAAREALVSDPKTRAENLMIVDLLRNDLSLVCAPGTVEVPHLMEVESYESVNQLVSTVRGTLADHVSTVAALRALFPAGSMTGAPKLRTMQIIGDVEATPRGVYAGAFGWVSATGEADLGVVIRSLTTAGDGTWRLGTGGGITVRSDVHEEWAETVWKSDRLLAALPSQDPPTQLP